MNRLDELRQCDQLLGWVEQGLLSPGQAGQALAPAEPKPTAAHWRWALDRLLGFLGCLLLALGVIFFFAFNWDDMHRLHKVALVLLVLSGFAGAALFLQAGSTLYRASLVGAALTTGAALAVVGQIYQTGADIWQLFASWAVLMLPWVLLARSTAGWLLFWLVANLALALYLAVPRGWLGVGPFSARALFGMAFGNLVMLLLFELAGRHLAPNAGRILPRLAGLMALAVLSLGAGIGWEQGGYRGFLVGLGLVYLLAIPTYLELRRDLLMLALLAYSLVAVGSAGLGHWLADRVDHFSLLNLLGLVVLLGSALATLWLHHLYRESRQ